MALNPTQTASTGIWGAIKGALGLFADINKSAGVTENNNPQPIDPYESTYTEDKIISLIGQWKGTYTTYNASIEPSQQLSFEYWIGKQRTDEIDTFAGQVPLVDNKIFESVETFIPIATRANPDPLVQADPTDIGQRLAHDIKQALVHEADRQKLRKLLKAGVRHWIIYRLGVWKVSYNTITDEIETTVINPKRLVLDKNGHWDEAGFFTGEYIGEKKKITADKLVEMFPKKKDIIMEKAQDKMGTELEYFEWWYRNKDIFFTMDETVLGKFKNPHWNYDQGETVDPATGQQLPAQPGKNHFKEPKAPYVGLTVFTTGLQPHDETSLILQNVGIQDMINRRWRQIDKNVEGMNNGMAVGNGFTEAQAAQAANALRRGQAIRVPSGNVNEQIARLPAPPIPNQVFETLRDGREELRNIFGTSGSTPEGVNSQDTVRGKILVNQLDSSRIGGGVTEYIEQVADSIYNYWVQMMFVHYTDEHYIVTAGTMGGTELITIKNTVFGLVKSLLITVKEGSLIPKDPLTQRNEAMDLWSAQAIDPRTLFQRLDFPDANEATKQLLLWQQVQAGQIPPQMYIPDFPMPQMQPGMPGQPGQMGQPQPGVGGPAVNPLGPPTPGAPAPQATQGGIQQASQQLLGQVQI